MEAKKKEKKVKVFIFAPDTEGSVMRKVLSPYNNVRDSMYITPYQHSPYLRVRVRNNSDSVIGVCRQFAAICAPIVEYQLGEGIGSKLVGTIRVERKDKNVDDFQKVIKIAEKICCKVWRETQEEHRHDSSRPEVFLTCRVSDILARDETPWVEIFSVQKNVGAVNRWKAAVEEMAEALGAKAVFWEANITEY